MHIAPAELRRQLQSANPPRLLDVREPEENQFAALPGSTLIPLGQLADRTDELEAWRTEDFVVYCHHGIRSARAVGYLRSLGFTGALNLSGGIDRWSTEVDPSIPRY